MLHGIVHSPIFSLLVIWSGVWKALGYGARPAITPCPGMWSCASSTPRAYWRSYTCSSFRGRRRRLRQRRRLKCRPKRADETREVA